MTEPVPFGTSAATGPGSQHPIRRLLRNPFGLASLIVLTAIVFVAILAPWLAPFDPNASRPELTNVAPFTSDYVLGGDSAGRDVLSRLIWAARSTMLASLTVLAVSLVIGVVAGLLAGYYGGVVQAVTNWVSDAVLALPGVVLLIAMYAVLGPNILLAMAVYGVLVSPIFYRLVRGVVAGVRHELYIDAAKVSGLGDARILFRHVLRAVRSPVIIQSAFILGTAVGIQAALEFLGLGSPRDASWGGMLDLAFRNIYVDVSGVVWPAITVTVVVLAFVLLGNALRDALDPSSKRRTLTGRQAARLRSQAVSHNAVPDEVVPDDVDTDVADPDDGVIGDTPADAVLSVRDLRVGYPAGMATFRDVVQGVDLDVRRGEIVGLVGESGSGKSQTAFAVLGLLPRNAVVIGGSVRFDGIEILQQKGRLQAVRGSRIGYIPQEPMTNLDPTMTIGKQLVYGLRAVRHISRAEAETRLIDLLHRVGIPDADEVTRRYPHEISGGMAQRVLIAGAVAPDPDLIIADEPTTALDVTVQAEVLDLIRELRDERGLAVIMVTHDLGVVSDLCDRVAVMREGRIVESSPTVEFFGGPGHDYSRELLHAAAELG
ncbi:dipeptide/oligopeptide/nickel ABC transporter permease/ATP-binding protein [Phytoactinopolyspora endophytica]|uniref:dipeptide/oligopeptide/nickel ABC transporter permease/ATP-binding protein n=1 Tax=Phytoactinopolyspora endophytica TaxID=1642495 RepID=UPI00101CA430|nr:dipeptide/oligopeptide/nickel ABC transporter permease/ATP-binding protein [Phytoactinopolyspora endophytica]